MLFEHGENVVRRVACLELGDEWMCCEVILCAFLVCFEGIIENELEVGGRYGSSVKVEHDPGARRSLVSREDGRLVSARAEGNKEFSGRKSAASCLVYGTRS